MSRKRKPAPVDEVPHDPRLGTHLDEGAPALIERALSISDAELAAMPAEAVATVFDILDEYVERCQERIDYATLALARLNGVCRRG